MQRPTINILQLTERTPKILGTVWEGRCSPTTAQCPVETGFESSGSRVSAYLALSFTISLFRNVIRSLFLRLLCDTLVIQKYFMKQRWSSSKSGPSTWDGLQQIILVQQFWNLTHRLVCKSVSLKTGEATPIGGRTMSVSHWQSPE